MKLVKKLILSLSIVITMLIALVIGCLGNSSPQSVPGGGIINNETASPSKDVEYSTTTYTFEPEEVLLQKGGDSINYNYTPSENATNTAKTVVFEYVFGNPMQHASAVNLKEIDTTDVQISYAWSKTKLDLDEEITTYSDYVCQVLEQYNSKVFIYIFVTPTKTNIPINFSSSVIWYYGRPKQITISSNVSSSTTTQTVVDGQLIDKNTLAVPKPPSDDYKFEGWYLDKECTQQVQGETLPETQMYARYWNFPEKYLTLVGDHYEVTKVNEPLTGDITIPAYYNGLPVTKIADGDINAGLQGDYSSAVFFAQTGITNIELPSTMQYIGFGAFIYCAGLTNVVLPDSISTINVGAFALCLGMQTIKLPRNLTAILPLTFSDCTSLTYVDASYSNIMTITGDESSGLPGPFGCSGDYGNSQLQTIDLTGCTNLTSIGDSAFYLCNNLSSIIIPDSVTSIGEYAFSDCSSLSSIIIPDSVTSIGEFAFSDCSSLSSIIIPDSVTSIGERAFSDCIDLTSIDLSECINLTSIGDSAFRECSNLSSIDLSKCINLTSIVGYAFKGCSGLTSIDLSKCTNLTSIGNDTFSDCTSLTSITIPASVTSIGNYAFSNCSSLTSITIPASVTSIGVNAFAGCGNLSSINLEDNDNIWQVGSLGKYMYNDDVTINANNLTNTYSNYTLTKMAYPSGNVPDSYMSYNESGNYYKVVAGTTTDLNGITNLVIPATYKKVGYPKADVKIIAPNAFKAASITSVLIPNTVTNIENEAFYACINLRYINLPKGVNVEDNSFDNCRSLSDTTYNNGRYIGDSFNNYLILTKATSYTITSLNIHETTQFIANSAFENCYDLISVSMSASVTSIGKHAFYDCSNLSSIDLSKCINLTSIGDSAFSGCDNLSSITIPASITSIGDYAFAYCSDLSSITIPASVTSIGYNAFFYCSSLSSIIIPDSVTSIGSYAFQYCSNLKTVYNLSKLAIVKGSTDYGYVAYYADNVYTSLS